MSESVADCEKFAKCGHPKTPDNVRKSGNSIRCFICKKAQVQKWIERNRERVAALSRKWRTSNPEKMKLINKRWYDNNPKQIQGKNKARQASGKVLEFKHHITLDEYNVRLAEQGGVCAICKGVEEIAGWKFAVDHDHKCCKGPRTCGKCIRGLLCQKCNHLLGNARDSISNLENAIEYLRKQKEIVIRYA